MIEEISNFDISGCNSRRLFHHKGLEWKTLTNDSISKQCRMTFQISRTTPSGQAARSGVSGEAGRRQRVRSEKPWIHFLTRCRRTLDFSSQTFCDLYEQLHKWNAFSFCHKLGKHFPPRIMKRLPVRRQASNWVVVNLDVFITHLLKISRFNAKQW